MLMAMLRHQGVPACARCGFGTYFRPNRNKDHLVVEYWKAADERWVMVDKQLDVLQRRCWQSASTRWICLRVGLSAAIRPG